MMEQKVVLSADTHLAPRSWAKYPGLAGDAYYGLQQLVDYCCNNELDLVLAGDVFDKTRPDPRTTHVMRTQIDRLERQNLALYFVQGQHELDRESPWLRAISWWPEHVHRKRFEIMPDVYAYGLDWTPADQVREEFSRIERGTDILIAHQVWRDLMGPRIGESECAFADVPVTRVILTGDFHRHLQMLTLNRDTATTRVLSPGPVCMQSIDEDPEKRFFVLNEDMSVSSQLLRTRQCFRFNITNKEELEIFLTGNVEAACTPQANVPEHIAKNIIHIRYHENIPEIYTRLTNMIGTRAHLFLVPIRVKQEVITIENERRRALAAGGMEACLELLTPKDEKLFRDVMSLLNSGTPLEQLKTIKALYLQALGQEHDRR